MEILYYPNKGKVEQAIEDDDPLLMLVSFDGKKLLISNIDDALEHVILLRKLGFQETEIDSYFRVISNKEGADWTFVCPANYKGITNKKQRIETYYADGFDAIRKALDVIGYEVEITVPKRYRRHIDIMGNNF
jgi:hypothetical protein